jgi:hypothetical protein
LNPDINPIVNRVFDLLLGPFIESMRIGVLLRGTISYGAYYFSDQLIIGEALADAAYNHDKLKWIRVSLSPTLSTRLIIFILSTHLLLYGIMKFTTKNSFIPDSF